MCGAYRVPAYRGSQTQYLILKIAAKEAFLKIAAKEALPAAAHRNTIRDSRDMFVETSAPYGAPHTEIKVNDSLTLEYQNPFAVFWYACNTSASFSSMVVATLASHPSPLASQWNLVLYCDEVSPGNQLAYTHDRKTWAI